MQTDAYTKTVLAIIAAGVLFIAFRDVPVISNAQAQNAVQPTDVNVFSIGGVPVIKGSSLPVVVTRPVSVDQGQGLVVRVRDANELPVRITNGNMNEIPVKVTNQVRVTDR